MSLRFLRLVTHDLAYLRQFYAARPHLAAEPYEAHRAALLADGYGWADFWAVALAKRGYVATDVVANAETLQRRWAAEQGLPGNAALPEIALAQVQAFAPDVLLMNTFDPAFGPAFIETCRARCPSIRLVLGWLGEIPPLDPTYFRAHDLVLTCAPDRLEALRAHGLAAEHLNHAFDPRILQRIGTITPQVDAGFIGQVVYGEQYHNTRARLLHDVMQQFPLAFYSGVPTVAWPPFQGLKGAARRGYYTLLDGLHRAGLDRVVRHLPRYNEVRAWSKRAALAPLFAALQQQARPPVFGLEMFRTLATFKICLNAHGPSAYASNMRLFEATGVGVCLLTDWKPNLADLFEPEVEVVTYRRADEAVEKLRYLLDHDDERRKIAAAGQRRTLRDHTFDRRAERLDALIQDYLRRS